MARIDDLAQRLAADHVIVEPVAANGHLDEYVTLLHDDVAAAPFPMYVAVLDRIPGDGMPDSPDQIAQLLHRRIGEDGVYIVGWEYSTDLISVGLPDVDRTNVSLAFYDVIQSGGMPRLATAAEAHVMADLAPIVGTDHESSEAQAAIDELKDTVADDPMMLDTTIERDTTPFHGPNNTDADPAAAGAVLVGVLVALVAGRYLSWRGAVRRLGPERATGPGVPTPRADPASELSSLRATARRHLEEVGAAPDNTGNDAVAALVAAHWTTIDRHTEAARELITSDDRADLVGAVYLATRARRAARRVRLGKSPNWDQPCYFDPRHSAATGEVTLPGGSGLTVPGCATCRDAIDADQVPDTVTVPSKHGDVAYYTRHDVWSLTGFGALRDDVADLVIAGGRGGKRPPRELAS